MHSLLFKKDLVPKSMCCFSSKLKSSTSHLSEKKQQEHCSHPFNSLCQCLFSHKLLPVFPNIICLLAAEEERRNRRQETSKMSLLNATLLIGCILFVGGACDSIGLEIQVVVQLQFVFKVPVFFRSIILLKR